mgnify:CR=1 FL=1
MSAKLFNLLCEEKNRIRDVILPEIDRREQEAYLRNDVEALKEVIQDRKVINRRLAQIVRLKERIYKSWEDEEGEKKSRA